MSLPFCWQTREMSFTAINPPLKSSSLNLRLTATLTSSTPWPRGERVRVLALDTGRREGTPDDSGGRNSRERDPVVAELLTSEMGKDLHRRQG